MKRFQISQAVLLGSRWVSVGASVGIFLWISLQLTGCTSTPVHEVDLGPGPQVSIMAYNVENLFDTEDDPDRNDEAYLPLTAKQTAAHKAKCAGLADRHRDECLNLDWSQEVMERKMERIADAVLQVNRGRGPDILILVEVENMNALSQLNSKYLSKAGYVTQILIEGYDTRGIDLAILSRLPQKGEAKLHKVPFKPQKGDEVNADRMRGILEASLSLPDGELISVFAVHFPAAYNPTYLRKQAVDFLNSLLAKLPKDRVAIAGGDFNITSAEEKDKGYYSKDLASQWQISHLIGCAKCEGTNYFHPKRQWSFLDALLFSPTLKPGTAGWEVVPASIHVANQSLYQVNSFGNPARFEPKGSIGVSDHWPIVGTLRKVQTAPSN